MQAQDIINNFTVILEKLFKSVENQVFEVLDEIILIGPDILKSEPLKYIFFENKVNGLIIIANSFLLFFFIYYVLSNLISMYNGKNIPNMYSFIIRILLVAILVNCSYFICNQILEIFELFSESVEMFTKEICKQEINFVNLKEAIISLEDFMQSDVLSLDGIMKGVLSFGALSILIQFSIRYVTIIFLLMISPFAFVSLMSDLTQEFFKTWMKLFVTNLLVQVVVKLLILIPLLYKHTNHTMYKIILVGSIYLIYKTNQFVKELFAKFSSDVQSFDIFRS